MTAGGENTAGNKRRSAILVPAGVVVGAVAIATAVAVAVSPGGGRRGQPASARVCPWHYVAPDDDRVPVPITDAPADRRVIGVYEPGQVFYAAEPPVLSRGSMKTVDGWVVDGGWIQRSGGACLKVPPASVVG